MIPDFQTCMLPLLRLAGDKAEHRFRDAVTALAVEFGLTEEEKRQHIPSGPQPLITNRIGWAKTHMQRARKGIFITTSTFTDQAREFVSRIESKVVLIDGEELARLMIDHGIGVALSASYQLKRIDPGYFGEE